MKPHQTDGRHQTPSASYHRPRDAPHPCCDDHTSQPTTHQETIPMATSLYDLSVASYLQILPAVSGFLDKGLAHFTATGTLEIGRRYAEALLAAETTLPLTK
jgi:hypothetical protein